MELFDIDWQAILPFVAIGFLAQLVDGALGMAFGAIATTLLVGVIGTTPALASLQVHAIKCFTTAASGASHAFAGNIDKRLLIRVTVPGVIGGVIGAYGLAQIDGEALKPFVFGYLGVLGLLLVRKGLGRAARPGVARGTTPLGFVGGVLDAVGGGGWGPVVSSGLMLQGVEPRKVVGSINSAEFFVAIAISVAFIGHFGFAQFTQVTIGLLVGGVLAAPLGALAARLLPARALLVVVGAVLSATTAYWFARSMG